MHIRKTQVLALLLLTPTLVFANLQGASGTISCEIEKGAAESFFQGHVNRDGTLSERDQARHENLQELEGQTHLEIQLENGEGSLELVAPSVALEVEITHKVRTVCSVYSDGCHKVFSLHRRDIFQATEDLSGRFDLENKTFTAAADGELTRGNRSRFRPAPLILLDQRLEIRNAAVLGGFYRCQGQIEFQ